MKCAAANSSPNHDEDRLDGWEEIASFFGRGVRTVQRWEREVGLPVRRLFTHRRSLVHAYRAELEHWLKGREEKLFPVPNAATAPPVAISPDPLSSRDVLIGWKEMAAFLGRSIRTVQRWEKDGGLPVRRPEAHARSVPFAFRSEIVTWLKECGITTHVSPEGALSTPVPPLLQAFIDGHGATIAVLNTDCKVVAANRAWKKYAQSGGTAAPNFGLGSDIFDLLQSAAFGGAKVASALKAGVMEMLSGLRSEFLIKYPTKRSSKKQWFLFHVTRFNFRGSALLIVTHADITGLMEH